MRKVFNTTHYHKIESMMNDVLRIIEKDNTIT